MWDEIVDVVTVGAGPAALACAVAAVDAELEVLVTSPGTGTPAGPVPVAEGVRGWFPDVSDADLDAFFERWLDILEQRDLLFSGSAGRGKFEGFIMRAGRDSATEEDRQAIKASLAGDALFLSNEIDELSDAWH